MENYSDTNTDRNNYSGGLDYCLFAYKPSSIDFCDGVFLLFLISCLMMFSIVVMMVFFKSVGYVVVPTVLVY